MKKKLLVLLLVCGSQAYASSRKYGDELEKNLKYIQSTMATKDDLQQCTKGLATASDLNKQMDICDEKLEQKLEDSFAQQSAAIDRCLVANHTKINR